MSQMKPTMPNKTCSIKLGIARRTTSCHVLPSTRSLSRSLNSMTYSRSRSDSVYMEGQGSSISTCQATRQTSRPRVPVCSRAEATSNAEPSHVGLVYTSFEGNAWRLELPASGARILVDPWLVGPLTFGGLDMLFKGEKKVAREDTIDVDDLAAQTDFILLTMAIDDHAHRPTLRRLPKTIPVVGSPSAAEVARQLGYKRVYELDHGQQAELCNGNVVVKAVKGALVGPPWSKRENGYVITEKSADGTKEVVLYYEPHADYVEETLQSINSVDVVVMPPSTQSLLGYDLVKGATAMVPLLKRLKPRVVIPLLNAEFNASGPLHDMLSETGGAEELQAQLRADEELRDIRVCVPKPAEPMRVSI